MDLSEVDIPKHVLAAFQVDDTPASSVVPAGPVWDNGARFGRVVVSTAAPTAAWAAKVRERLAIDGMRVARPVRATDGRFVVGGFKASEYAEGEVVSRVDEAIAAALSYEEAMREVAGPTVQRTDRFADADRAAWRDVEVPGPTCVAHADFLFSCAFSGSLPPLLTDIVPTAEPRPAGYTAALVLVDGLLTRSVDDNVVSRWAHIAHLPELALRAVEYREILATAAHSNMRSEIERVRTLLVSA
ncbi:hypothetical protein [Corynebacterium timonense]|uniref:TIGR02569 family protein n=1 Tax=Corynebacterium timonense TaxID=441500 RepID=A0A1H1RN23_9CORY|nr:hypothetical protein [Corynebacterium timonense]SDS37171.1 TIGR02569 family protein [Corynebacterium timonense]